MTPPSLSPQNAPIAPPRPDLEPDRDWVPELPPTDLVFEDGIPLESNRHRLAMNLLIDSIYTVLSPRQDFFVGGNMFVYFSLQQIRSRDFRGPDVFVALGVDGNKERQGWVVWEEAGKYPDVIIELMSPSTAEADLTTKKALYAQTFRTGHYFVYDPFEPSTFQGWHLQGGDYVALERNDRGWLWCSPLNLWFGPWHGKILMEQATWLRAYDAQGQLVPLAAEQAEQERLRAEQERLRAEDATAALARSQQQQAQLKAKLQELGIDPETLV